MRRLQAKGRLRQFQRRVGISIGQLLAQDAPDSNKPRAIILQEPFIGLFCLGTVARHFGGLRGQKVGQRGFIQVTLGAGGARHRHVPLARGQRQHTLRQRTIALFPPVAVEIARYRRVIAVDEPQYGDQQTSKAQEQPERKEQDTHRQHGLQRGQVQLDPCNDDTHAAIQFQQVGRAERHQNHEGQENDDLDE